MTRGPDKQFDPDVALGRAMELFWAKGYASTGLAELLEAMGIGRKSMYDTFGNKRQLYFKALQLYSKTFTQQLDQELNDPKRPALENVRRLLRALQSKNCEDGSSGCMLGVSMAQCSAEDEELADILRLHMKAVEDAFYRAFKRAQDEGALRAETKVRDLARFFMSTLQGLALIGRITATPAIPRSIVDAALRTLEVA